ncbi:MAG: serpin family protein [archaeon]|nr:serpin family protein [archaeon]
MDKKHIPTRIIIVIAVALVIFISGCAKQPAPMADDAGATPEKVSSVVNANNQFAFELYSKYKDDPKYKNTNIFFSPYSISTALAMTYEGARGQTAEEMQSVVHFPENPDVRRPAFARIYNEINSRDKEYQLSTANALWAQKDYQFLDEYFNITEKYYGGKVTNLDFIQETEKSRVTINKWVEVQTNDKIKDLIPSGVLDSMTRLVLTNAIYFKGTWVLQFDKSKTRETDFRVSPASTVKAQMMSLTGEKAKFDYAETDDLQILELPYKGNELSMLILLPKKDNLDAVEESLSAEKLSKWKNMLMERKTDVYLPKFKFETKYFMADDLSSMGMPTAFGSFADFSGMTGKKDLFISQVIHQAFVEVNEEGTEAAAATAVVMKELSASMPNIFRADHPFIFIIQQKDTGNILFLGKVMDPTK